MIHDSASTPILNSTKIVSSNATGISDFTESIWIPNFFFDWLDLTNNRPC